jgi:HEPN domain-containing protein
MPTNDLPPVGSVERWLRFADSDLCLAKIQLSGDVMIEALCFHAQQAVEKAIKAVLVHFDIPVPRTHVIELIIDKAEQKVDVPKFVREAANLTPYASVTRYPGNYEPRTDADLLDAIQKAEKVVIWAKEVCDETQ